MCCACVCVASCGGLVVLRCNATAQGSQTHICQGLRGARSIIDVTPRAQQLRRKTNEKLVPGYSPDPPGRFKIEPRTFKKSIRGASWTIWGVPGRFGDASGALLDALGTLQGAPGALPGRPRGTVWLHGRATGASRRILEARSDAFFVRYGHRPDFSTIFVRCFDENSIDFVEQLLDDRRSLDDAFVVPARMHDIEKTLKNLDRAHKIRVRRCSADPCAKVMWTANYFENASKKRTETRTAKRSQNLVKIDAQDPRKSTSEGSERAKSWSDGPDRAAKRRRSARGTRKRKTFSQWNAARAHEGAKRSPARGARSGSPRAPV